jgi:hypothetical protein
MAKYSSKRKPNSGCNLIKYFKQFYFFPGLHSVCIGVISNTIVEGWPQHMSAE